MDSRIESLSELRRALLRQGIHGRTSRIVGKFPVDTCERNHPASQLSLCGGVRRVWGANDGTTCDAPSAAAAKC